MILYIAEKPSLGRAIADVLPKPHKKGDGHIISANGDCVSWCIGHLLEQAEPDAYDPAYKSWKFEHLPIIPQSWKMKVKPKTRSQLMILRRLVKQATQLVNAGDPDREGQLLVDEVIAHLGVKGEKLHLTQRLLINDLNPQAVKRALGQMRSNREFIPLSTSALARSRADWLYGLNMTRAYTIQGRKVGYQGVLSVGRVQTPLLGLVVRRDEDIAHFISIDFFEVLADLTTEKYENFKAKWQPSETCHPYMDEEGRVLSKGLAQNVVSRITEQAAHVLSLESKDKKQNQPLPYSLSALQIDAAKRYGMSAKEVLDICQALYEKHKLITYPRSDSRYLPAEQYSMGSAVVKAVLIGASELVIGHDQPDLKIKSKAWNDNKVDAHHAIIPTEKTAKLNGLSPRERQIYLLVARQYLAQFYGPYQYHETLVEIDIAGGRFKTKAKQDKALGWKQLFSREETKTVTFNESKENEVDTLQTLPPLVKGQLLYSGQGVLVKKQTQAPKHFTDATLLGAMTGINRYVTNPEIRKILKDTDGLGTEATRAGIIELLFKRNFLLRQGKLILATDVGKGLINSLPMSATTPDMTALWESNLDAISRKEAKYLSFMGPLLNSLSDLISQAGAQLPSALQGICTPVSSANKKNSLKPASKTTRYSQSRVKKSATNKPSR